MNRLLTRLALIAATVGAASIFPAVALALPQANDSFAAAEEITGTRGFTPGANHKATKEPGEPAHAGNAGGASLWYRWVAPADAETAFTAFPHDEDMDPLLAVYTGSSVEALTEIASNDDWQGFASRVTFAAVAGTEYRIAVDGYGGKTGAFGLAWHTPPANDDFADAVEIAGRAGTLAASNSGAEDEPGEPDHAGCGFAAVWYRWTAPVSEHVRFDTRGSDFDTTLAVYTGTAVDALTGHAANDDFRSLRSDLSFRATAGTTYSIAVGGCGGSTGDFTLNWYPGTIILGTQDAEVLRGTSGRDFIDARGGKDIIRGLAGADEIIGGSGADHLYGGPGNDRLNSRDGQRGNDVIQGGRGRDAAGFDRGDVILGVP